jgi:hypothetical protein
MLGEDIAFLGRGEVALRRQTEPSGLVNFVASSMRRLSAPLDCEHASLARDQPNFVVAIYMLIRTRLALCNAA